MKKFIAIFLLTLAIVTIAFRGAAIAGDADKGRQIFSSNCAQCHIGGRNLIQSNKSLKKADLDRYNMNSLDAIVAQVTKGRNAMPAFKGRLTSSNIEDVAAYVLREANEKDWKK